MSAALLLNEVDSIADGYPFIITGDFNMIISSKGYEILTVPYGKRSSFKRFICCY